MERGPFGLVSGVDILSRGILRLQVSETEVNNISIHFLNKTSELTTGKTKPETILCQLNTKKGSMLQVKRDMDSLPAMSIMDDISIVPQPARGMEASNKNRNPQAHEPNYGRLGVTNICIFVTKLWHYKSFVIMYPLVNRKLQLNMV